MRAVLAALLIVLAAPALAAPTDARDYDAFFLWAGVKPQAVLAEARDLYLLQGQVDDGDPVRLVSQRQALPRVAEADVWMVVRVETLDWPETVYGQVLAALGRWRAAGNKVVGIQIDFDAGTRHLENYAAFLGDLKQRLPADCLLSITGLLDWSSNGDPAGLAALGGVVDEVVLQIYQGRRVIPGYAGYLAALKRLELPFRIGLLQGGDWEAPDHLAGNPWFRGYVVFLVNE
ncbi:DUF3142 domain-containing protein [Dongia sp.]|uniref:DUF3142 domain-containing protein n=1 Tax=Dongia sp. TaxID=1977262 RepID=UPI003750B145